MKILVTGSTGMIGKGVVLEAIDDPAISLISVINRRKLNLQHPKLEEIILPDFFDIDSIANQLSGFDACLFCLGTTAVGKDEDTYRHITYDLTLLFAKTYLRLNPEGSFCYVSGAGTDSSEAGRMMWARVKGKTENDLLAMPFRHVHCFRPGYIQPLRGIRSATGWYNTMYGLVGFLFPLLKRLPKYITDTTRMGRAMINVAKHGYEKQVLESFDINRVATTSNH